MNEKKWEEYLRKYTADIGVEPGEQRHVDELLLFMNSFIEDSEEMWLLDVGCSTAYLRDKIKANWFGMDCVVNGTLIKQLDAQDMPEYMGKEFDIIFASHVLEHTIAPLLALVELKRIMKDEGNMIIALPVYPGYMYDGHNYMMPAGSWIHLFKRVGLRLEHRQDNEKNNTAFFHLKKERK